MRSMVTLTPFIVQLSRRCVRTQSPSAAARSTLHSMCSQGMNSMNQLKKSSLPSISRWGLFW